MPEIVVNGHSLVITEDELFAIYFAVVHSHRKVLLRKLHGFLSETQRIIPDTHLKMPREKRRQT
jgi:hypothetical protein